MNALRIAVPPELPGAACAGRSPWWDIELCGESDDTRARRLDAAVAVCRRCPALAPCSAQRPTGARAVVWAGKVCGSIPRAHPETTARHA